MHRWLKLTDKNMLFYKTFETITYRALEVEVH